MTQSIQATRNRTVSATRRSSISVDETCGPKPARSSVCATSPHFSFMVFDRLPHRRSTRPRRRITEKGPGRAAGSPSTEAENPDSVDLRQKITATPGTSDLCRGRQSGAQTHTEAVEVELNHDRAEAETKTETGYRK